MKIRQIVIFLMGVMVTLVMNFAKATELVSSSVNHQVVISGFEFVPKKLEVSMGDTVTWINKDIVPHNIAINTKQKALSPEIASGQQFVYKVNKSFSYICGLHPSMKGQLIISK